MANRIDKLVGERIGFRRKQLGLSLVEAAGAVGVDPFTFKRFESGATRINARQLLKVCNTFDAPPSYFILCDTSAENLESARVFGSKHPS
jgi:transcriptional regulator with XRE-family HTH domain